ncbi:MAG: twin-arginine translocase TatA/TatE family subunit [Gemmatimonadetes bacterium]|nr:twin-arginine translocase TatA/TatE family subunit [Gemmatimonadota bacterium]MYA65235.1 twin-arginine translocase TatA/TatE family subunit [Gemmatimonadota bacterium]MYC00269.1 twin-arginine translocase TatA/TatE family subunit [Gemmatimonadota bacterium]MYH52433.1 twin-arginine translocase TatA/TatE family subunit [Gemmatimonadota bacterium]MYK65334.1 twin-arginine translocase TatA/TatE family subunit [Gemmatimonadota bacterium]
MPTIGIREILFILLIFALIFGAKRLPDIARGLGSGIRNFKGSIRAPKTDDSGDTEDPHR